MDDDDVCVICGVDPSKKASNLTRRTLQTNVSREVRCGHSFCNACVERHIAKKSQFPCPVAGCGAAVRKAQLDARTLEDIEVERDATHRKRVLAVFNATPESFATPRAYDDYLEEVEDAIYALRCWRGRRGGREEAERAAANADGVAARAAAKIEQDRLAAAEIDDDRAAADAAAAKLEQAAARQAGEEREEKHALAYALGDRADAPVRRPRRHVSAAVLPAPIGRPANPSHVTGDALARRRKAGGWTADLFKKRARDELLAGCDASGLKRKRPPYAHPSGLLFGQRTAPAAHKRAKIVKAET
ncbi:cyclin-dependent protein serine/threonine kinase activator [Aureococcus anophagefferens]|nr:cyclin-dependent protein serine/threonine kinase activator [Aureococcus anophagefferens]